MANPGIVFPLVLLGAAVLFLGGSTESVPEEPRRPEPGPPRSPAPAPPPAPAPAPPPSPVPRGILFQMLMGDADRAYAVPVRVTPSEVVVLFSEFEEDYPDGTRTQLCHVSSHATRSECIWLAEPPQAILEALGALPGQFIKVHQPLGKTDPRPHEDEDTTELVPMWINWDHIEMIGPSPVLDTKRRRLGKIYTKNGLDFQLYESLDRLKEIVGPKVKVIEVKFRPRELK